MSHSLSKLLLLYAQQFEDQHAPQNMTIALREAADTITRLTAENEKLKAALVRWLDAVNDKRAFEHHQPDNLGKEWARLRKAFDLAEDNARAALSGDKHE